MLKPHVTLSEQTAMTKPLFPAAQAVDFAVYGPSLDATRRQIAAAALRAAANELIPPVEFDRRYTTRERWDARDDIRAELLAIAAELEGAE